MILMRRPGVEAVAERLKTTPKRVSLWSGRFETLGLKGLDDKPGLENALAALWSDVPVQRPDRVILVHQSLDIKHRPRELSAIRLHQSNLLNL